MSARLRVKSLVFVLMRGDFRPYNASRKIIFVRSFQLADADWGTACTIRSHAIPVDLFAFLNAGCNRFIHGRSGRDVVYPFANNHCCAAVLVGVLDLAAAAAFRRAVSQRCLLCGRFTREPGRETENALWLVACNRTPAVLPHRRWRFGCLLVSSAITRNRSASCSRASANRVKTCGAVSFGMRASADTRKPK